MFFDQVKVSALVDDAGGALTVGSDVKSRGVILGEVTSVTSSDGRVRIGMTLDGDQARLVPRSVEARVIAATVFGTTSVDLVVPDDASTSAQGLPAGHVIQQDKSAKTLELQNTLDSTDRVLTAIEPAKLATTLSSIAGAVRGRGTELGGTLQMLESYLAAAGTTSAVVAGGPPPGRHQPASPRRRLAGAPRRDRQLPHHDAHGRGEAQGARHLPHEAHHLVDTADASCVTEEADHVTLANAATAFDALYDHRVGLADGFRSFVTFAERGSRLLRRPVPAHRRVHQGRRWRRVHRRRLPAVRPGGRRQLRGRRGSSSRPGLDPTEAAQAPSGDEGRPARSRCRSSRQHRGSAQPVRGASEAVVALDRGAVRHLRDRAWSCW